MGEMKDALFRGGRGEQQSLLVWYGVVTKEHKMSRACSTSGG
jgi:hypothetical protein